MIYLYDGETTDFRYNGKPLPKAYEVINSYEINTEFSVMGKHPLDKEEVYKQIIEDKIIQVNTPNGFQPFRIIDSQKYIDHVEFEAWPLFLADMRNKLVKPLSVSRVDGMTVLHQYRGSLLLETPFNFYSNINTLHDYNTQDVNERESDPNQFYDALDIFKDIVNRWDAEVVMDGYEVQLLERIGTDTQALLYEKKNISEFVDNTNISGIVTRVYGKSEWQEETDGVSEGESHTVTARVDSPLINEYSGVIFEKQYTNNNIRTQQEMENWLRLKFTTENIDKPSRTIEAGTNVVDGTYINPGDTLILKYIKHDVDITIRMVGYQYDGFADRYISTILGDMRERAFDTLNTDITSSYVELEQKTLSWLDGIRQSIVAGYFNDDGYNYDLRAGNEYGLPGGYYSFDAPIYENPSKVIYMGAGRLLIANEKTSEGEWKWETALTGDGLNASVMNTGILNADLVQIGWNSIYDWLKLLESGIAMEGAGGWRRAMYRSYGIDFFGGFSGYDDTGKGGSFGYFRTNYYHNDESYTGLDNLSNYFEDSERQRLAMGIGINYNHTFGVGYNMDPNSGQNAYKTALDFDPIYEDTGMWMFHTPLEVYVDKNRKFAIRENVDVYTDLSMQGHTIINQSDVRLKKKVKPIDFSPLEIIDKSGELKYFEWKDDHIKNKGKPKGQQLGLIAQENPYLSKKESDKVHYENIDEGKKINLLYGAVKELIDENKDLKKRISKLEDNNETA